MYVQHTIIYTMRVHIGKAAFIQFVLMPDQYAHNVDSL